MKSKTTLSLHIEKELSSKQPLAFLTKLSPKLQKIEFCKLTIIVKKTSIERDLLQNSFLLPTKPNYVNNNIMKTHDQGVTVCH